MSLSSEKIVRDIHAARRVTALLNSDPGLHIGENKEVGQYCQRVGNIAIVVKFDGPCTGVILRKGDGIGGLDDKYGESYKELCLKTFCSRRRQKLVV